jgi:hypothetical protein
MAVVVTAGEIFKILNPVVSFVTIDVVYVLPTGFAQESQGDEAVNASRQIPPIDPQTDDQIAGARVKGLSENFPLPRLATANPALATGLVTGRTWHGRPSLTIV